MRGIERATQFKKDYKREKKGKYREVLETIFVEVLVALANDNELAEKHRDHALTNNWSDHRDCHIKPDLILIYNHENPHPLLSLFRKLTTCSI